MYILVHALRSVWRHRGRNALLGTVILAVIVASVIALMICSASSAIIDDYKARFSSEVQFKPNMQRLQEEARAESDNGLVTLSMPTIDADEYLAYGESEYLAGADYTASTGITLDDVEAVDADLGGGTGRMMVGGPASADASSGEEPMLFMESLRGGSFEEFDDGTRSLASGTFPAQTGEVIVSSELADLNGLEVGDTLTGTGELQHADEGERSTISYDLTVVGTYTDLTDAYADPNRQNAFTNRRNEVLTTYETVLQPYVAGTQGIAIAATFYLKSPDLLDEYTDEVRGKGLSDVFDVTTDEAAYDRIVGPVQGLQAVSVTFLVVVLAFGGTIIALLASIAVRERKYEIGVLRAIGMKKSRVGLGLWVETLTVTIIGTAGGFAIGALLAQPVANILLAGQIEAAESSAEAAANQPPGIGSMVGPSSATDAQPLDSLGLALDPTTIAQVAALALLLATLAGIVAVIRITRYEPIRILQERN